MLATLEYLLNCSTTIANVLSLWFLILSLCCITGRLRDKSQEVWTWVMWGTLHAVAKKSHQRAGKKYKWRQKKLEQSCCELSGSDWNFISSLRSRDSLSIFAAEILSLFSQPRFSLYSRSRDSLSILAASASGQCIASDGNWPKRECCSCAELYIQ